MSLKMTYTLELHYKTCQTMYTKSPYIKDINVTQEYHLNFNRKQTDTLNYSIFVEYIINAGKIQIHFSGKIPSLRKISLIFSNSIEIMT